MNRNTKILKKGTVYNYTCKLNLNCPKNCYLLTNENFIDLFQCNSESHNHDDVSEFTKRRNLLNDMYLQDNFKLDEINTVLANQKLPLMDRQQFSNYKQKQKNKLNYYKLKIENTTD